MRIQWLETGPNREGADWRIDKNNQIIEEARRQLAGMSASVDLRNGEKVAIAFELAAAVDLATPAYRPESRASWGLEVSLSALPKKGGEAKKDQYGSGKRASAVGILGWSQPLSVT